MTINNKIFKFKTVMYEEFWFAYDNKKNKNVRIELGSYAR